MVSVLSIAVIVFSIIFMVGVCWQVAKGRLLLRYSLLWLFLGLVALVCAIFPEPVFRLAYFLGFNVASNFVLFVAIFFLSVICLSLSVIVSKQQMKLKDLVQRLAIMEKGIGDSGNAKQDDNCRHRLR